MALDPLNTLSTLSTPTGDYRYYSLERLPAAHIQRLPFSIRILLEGMLRHCDGQKITPQDVLQLAAWQPQAPQRLPIPFFPGRVILQDFSGVPVLNDLAAMRSALVRLGGTYDQINPIVPVDLIIDHSIQVDAFGSASAFERNTAIEFERNRDRYEFLHWCQQAFTNLRIIPPASGIIHQVNLEHICDGIQTHQEGPFTLIYPETQVGTDSHTTMINGLGTVAWGVGGIEAIAAMLGQPIEILTPEVIGLKFVGQLPEGVTPTDLTLTVTQLLRKLGVVDKFVEVFGPGAHTLSLADRAMVANMAPESGATMIYFPIDAQTIEYLRLSNRPADQIALFEQYCRVQHLFRSDSDPEPEFSQVLTVDLSTIEPSLAGPKRPQDRVALSQVKNSFRQALVRPKNERGFAVAEADLSQTAAICLNGQNEHIGHGAVVIAAITSCTNTSNPYVMIAAGLLAQKAVQRGLKVKPYVKTSLAPGSRVVTGYLRKAGLLEPLAALGFDLVAYGCTTCIGNSGPLAEEVVRATQDAGLVTSAVLSGNRNFEGRVSPHVQANYLASPPLVVAYALAGRVDIDLTCEALGQDHDGRPVYLRELWPTSQEIQSLIQTHIQAELFAENYADLFTCNERWNQITSSADKLYRWDADSTYLQEPPFFAGLARRSEPLQDICAARVLALFGDSITTDHISPAGNIAPTSAAGQYLLAHNVPVEEFNSYGTRRGNDRVMTRGTFANIRLKNLLLPGVEGSYTLHKPDNTRMSIYQAAMQYQQEGVPLVILAGKEYGTGSSRDWAAKGAQQLGVKVILAESFERIHRSNLAGMGVLPLQFLPGESVQTHHLTGDETFYFENLEQALAPGQQLTVRAVHPDGQETRFAAVVRLDTANELGYYRQAGILNTILLERLEPTPGDTHG